MIICPNCQRENEDEYKYCLGCGTVLPRDEQPAPKPVQSGLQCSNCNSEIPPNFKFCGECGTPVDTAAASVPKAQPAVAPPPPDTQPTPAVTEFMTAGGPTLGSLVVIKPDGSEGARIDVRDGEVRLGRDSPYEVLASDPFLSPHHASLISNSNGHFLRDADSLNGVFLRITTEVELQDGDFIRIGQELLQFRLIDHATAIVPRAEDPKTLTSGSPDSGFWGRLSLISGPDMESRGFVFSEDEVILGREVGDVLFRDDGFVSGRHARLAKVEGRIYLKDLGSSNGTYVRIRGERQLSNGDLVLMGQQLFRVEV